MRFYTLVAAISLALPAVANATCVGTGTFKTCTDSSGNNYTVSHFGTTTMVNGNNPNTGNSWSQQSYRFGNTTQKYGRDAQGKSWNQTSTPQGSYGTDSDGNSFYTPNWPK